VHVLVIPSWYPQFDGDPGGSFFREQAIALARRIEKVGVLFPNLRSMRKLLTPNFIESGVVSIDDSGTLLMQRNGYNWTPRWDLGTYWQFLRCGLELYDTYVKCHGVPDLIHAHSALNGGALARDISLRTNVPYIVTEHSSSYFMDLLSLDQVARARSVFSDSMANIAVSNSLEILLREKYNFGGRWQVIPNLVNGEFFRGVCSLGRRKSVRGKIIHVAMLTPNKRQDLLIDAIGICRKNGMVDITLSIVGDGAERDSIFRRIKALGVQNQVQMLGLMPRHRIKELMAEHDAFVLSSDYETFGVVVAEALASGIPCIVTDCGGPADIIEAGDGIVVPRGDASALASAMVAVVGDAYISQNARLARQGRCANRFGEDAVCRKVISCYANSISEAVM
jgi:L-malate glycosyltransferase